MMPHIDLIFFVFGFEAHLRVSNLLKVNKIDFFYPFSNKEHFPSFFLEDVTSYPSEFNNRLIVT